MKGTINAAVGSDIQQAGANELSASTEGSNYYIYIIAAMVLLVTLLIIFKRKPKSNKRQIGIVGERGAGKTQLFIGLSGGKAFESVPSIANNTCQFTVGRKQFKLCDFIGDNLSKDEVIGEIARFNTLVHVVDGADSKKLGDAALFIYRVLINKHFQKDPCNYVVFLNKNDLKTYHGQEKLVKRIEDEIETIKVSRRNLTEQNEEGEEDYLRNERTRFDLKKQGIEILVGSARDSRQSLVNLLEELC